MASQDKVDRELVKACEDNEQYTVSVLLRLNADPHTKRGQFTLLHYAAGLQDKDLLDLLIREGHINDINFKDSGYTLLHHACRRGSISCAKYLERRGADVTLKCDKNRTVLHLCVQSMKVDMVQECLTWKNIDKNAVDDKGNTALVMACDLGNMTMVQLLVNEGADVYTTNNNGDSALTYAVKNEDIKDIILNNSTLSRKTRNTLTLWSIIGTEFSAFGNAEIQNVLSAIELAGIDLNADNLKDLRHLDAADFKGVIPPVQARKFIHVLWDKFCKLSLHDA